MRLSRALSLVVVAGFAWTGCNPSDFNTVLDHAPVVSVGVGEGGTGSLWAQPLPPPAEVGTKSVARVLLSRKDISSMALVDYDLNGKATTHQVDGAAIADLGGSPVVSTAVRLDGTILLGIPSLGNASTPGGGVGVLTYVPQVDGKVTFQTQVILQGGATGAESLSHLGIAVAAGVVTGAAGGDFVVVGDNSVHLLSGPDIRTPAAFVTSTTCPNLAMAKQTDRYAFRSVAVGDLVQGSAGAEIVLGGQRSETPPGMVVFVAYDGTGALKCLPKTLSKGAFPTFGTSLAVDDFDGDGFADLAVGVPPDQVFVYFGPLDAVTEPGVTIRSAAPTGFGQRVASYHPLGQISAQLLVSDPGASAGQQTGGGSVYLFNVSRAVPLSTTASAVAVLFDANHEQSGGAFGLSVGGLLFNPGLCAGVPPIVQLVPWATSGPNLLTFFNFPVVPPAAAAVDPRCFAKQ